MGNVRIVGHVQAVVEVHESNLALRPKTAATAATDRMATIAAAERFRGERWGSSAIATTVFHPRVYCARRESQNEIQRAVGASARPAGRMPRAQRRVEPLELREPGGICSASGGLGS